MARERLSPVDGDKRLVDTCYHQLHQHRSAIPWNVIRPSVEMPKCPSKHLRSALSMRRDELGPWQIPLERDDGVAAPRHAAAWKTQHGCLDPGLACHIEPRNHLYRPAFPCYQIPWFPRCDRGEKPTPTALLRVRRCSAYNSTYSKL